MFESLDTPKNRFVKHVLRTFLAFTAEVRVRLEDAGCELDFRFIEEAIGLEEQLEET